MNFFKAKLKNLFLALVILCIFQVSSQENQLNLRVANEIASITSSLNDHLILTYIDQLKKKLETNSFKHADKKLLEHLIRVVLVRQRKERESKESQESQEAEAVDREKAKSSRYMHWRQGR